MIMFTFLSLLIYAQSHEIEPVWKQTLNCVAHGNQPLKMKIFWGKHIGFFFPLPFFFESDWMFFVVVVFNGGNYTPYFLGVFYKTN